MNVVPLPAKVPPQFPEYQYQPADVPRLPPEIPIIEESPVHNVVRDTVKDIAETELSFTVT